MQLQAMLKQAIWDFRSSTNNRARLSTKWKEKIIH
eukprot:CAMPEP_0113868334 /NCGR_PEP_ID=MMETSP0780_2-20120614/930_1 /TAXON_ID=652834 /ORGANISM="Palpitomonas bilix" /LENGTH=34 /DNA_ID=CAMNT_0000853403 /DNA_START=51 /DNA_END=152 /DNA_ORIENTATION=+ /assembly_acc=CAM_ASM_000599